MPSDQNDIQNDAREQCIRHIEEFESGRAVPVKFDLNKFDSLGKQYTLFFLSLIKKDENKKYLLVLFRDNKLITYTRELCTRNELARIVLNLVKVDKRISDEYCRRHGIVRDDDLPYGLEDDANIDTSQILSITDMIRETVVNNVNNN